MVGQLAKFINAESTFICNLLFKEKSFQNIERVHGMERGMNMYKGFERIMEFKGECNMYINYLLKC